MTMRAIAFFLAGLACAGHARRVHAKSPEQKTEPDSLHALASLLQADEAAAAWQASGAGLRHGPRAQKSSQSPALRADVRMEEEVAAPKMSQALPFVECPAHCDGRYAGDVGFDPLNFGAMGNLKWMREAELKHGRICMLATLGYILVDLGLRAPGAPQAVTSLQAHDVTVKSGHMMFLLFVVGVFEFPMYIAYPQMCKNEVDRAPGDYGFDPLGYKKSERYKSGFYSTAEVKNGRLAMLAFSGIVTANALYGKPFPYF